MAKNLQLAPGIEIDAEYIAGKLLDGQTVVGEYINQDIVQFFVRLMAFAGLSPNGLYDNQTNGYQFIDALVSKIREYTWKDRGDASSPDFQETDLTLDTTYRDLDLSSIIPIGATSVLLRVSVVSKNTAVGDGGILLLSETATSGFNASTYSVKCANTSVPDNMSSDCRISLPTSRIIKYNGTNSGNGINSIAITVAGWSF